MSTARDKAAALLNDRLDAIDTLANTHAREQQLREQLRDAEAETAAAWAAANSIGWSDKELTKLGFKRPVAKRTRRPKNVPVHEGA